MVEIKVLRETEVAAKELEEHEQIEDDIFEVPPEKGVKLIERGAARVASWTDFGENKPPNLTKGWSVEKDKLKVRKIKNGSVIDHIPSGRALTVLKILEVTRETDATVSLLMNVPSEKYGRKDIVKIEGKKPSEEELNEIALTAPEATINKIEEFEVADKRDVKLPDTIEGTVTCSTSTCVTNAGEPAEPVFDVGSRRPLRLRCRYCERITEEKEVLEQLGE